MRDWRRTAAEDDAGERSAGRLSRLWRRKVMRSGMVTGLLLAVVATGFVLAYRQHMQGNFHKLKERMAVERPQVAEPQPGGLPAVEITRTRQMEDAAPEFMSVTMLPGRGMNVLQIRAYVPGKGEADLLASPSVADAAAEMTKQGADAGGQASLTMGGAFEVPWADRIWNGEPADGRGIGVDHSAQEADGGLLLASAAYASQVSPLPDGAQAEATFHSSGNGWPSRTEVTVAALLSSHTVDFTVTARNTGAVAEPIGIGWIPRFSIPQGAASGMRLRIPGESRVETGGRDAVPTGRLLQVAGTRYDYTGDGGGSIPEDGLSECFADLQQDVLDNGPVAELSDAASGYRLRLTVLSPEIKAMHVVVPKDRSYVSIAPQFNYPDPFGREWDKTRGSAAEGAGMVELQPGKSVEWKVRLEILPLSSNAGGM